MPPVDVYHSKELRYVSKVDVLERLMWGSLGCVAVVHFTPLYGKSQLLMTAQPSFLIEVLDPKEAITPVEKKGSPYLYVAIYWSPYMCDRSAIYVPIPVFVPYMASILHAPTMFHTWGMYRYGIMCSRSSIYETNMVSPNGNTAGSMEPYKLVASHMVPYDTMHVAVRYVFRAMHGTM